MEDFADIVGRHMVDGTLNYGGLRTEVLGVLDGNEFLTGSQGLVVTVNALVEHIDSMFRTLWRAHLDVAVAAGLDIDLDAAVQSGAATVELSFLQALYGAVSDAMADTEATPAVEGVDGE